MARKRRLIFGEVAELYDTYRPDYPDELIDDLLTMAAGADGSRAVLEVGAGTGKATRLMAARGARVIAVEPSAEMAVVARRRLGGHRDVTVEESDFETWDPAGRTFAIVYAAQAWHWVDPSAGFAKAAGVLVDGGVLAAFWNRPVWSKAPLRQALLDVYRAQAPELEGNGDPMHPAAPVPIAGGDWDACLARSVGLRTETARAYHRTVRLTAEAYAGMLATHSSMRLLAEPCRSALIDALADAVHGHGGTLELPFVTWLHLARRRPHASR